MELVGFVQRCAWSTNPITLQQAQYFLLPNFKRWNCLRIRERFGGWSLMFRQNSYKVVKMNLCTCVYSLLTIFVFKWAWHWWSHDIALGLSPCEYFLLKKREWKLSVLFAVTLHWVCHCTVTFNHYCLTPLYHCWLLRSSIIFFGIPFRGYTANVEAIWER